LEILKWARENDCPWYYTAYSGAVQGGHLEILKWLRKNGCPWDDGIYYIAAACGHLEVLKWLRKNGYHAQMEICVNEAAEGGKLEVVEWIIANCTTLWDGVVEQPIGNHSYWDSHACFRAARGGHSKILKRYAQR
jgi:hypothetical protein